MSSDGIISPVNRRESEFLCKKIFFLRNGTWCIFETFSIVIATPEYLLVEIFGALGVKEIHFISADIFWTNRVPYLRNCESYNFQTVTIVIGTLENLLVEISGALGTKESHFLSKNVFWENAVGYLGYADC